MFFVTLLWTIFECQARRNRGRGRGPGELYYTIIKLNEAPQSLLIFVTLLMNSTPEMVYPVSNKLREIFSFSILRSL